jgi:hypothetical protein
LGRNPKRDFAKTGRGIGFRSICYYGQQHLVGRALAVFDLRARTNRLQDIFPLMAEVLKRLPFVQNGAVQVIE